MASKDTRRSAEESGGDAGEERTLEHRLGLSSSLSGSQSGLESTSESSRLESSEHGGTNGMDGEETKEILRRSSSIALRRLHRPDIFRSLFSLGPDARVRELPLAIKGQGSYFAVKDRTLEK